MATGKASHSDFVLTQVPSAFPQQCLGGTSRGTAVFPTAIVEIAACPPAVPSLQGVSKPLMLHHWTIQGHEHVLYPV